jgi:hypothetical protein
MKCTIPLRIASLVTAITIASPLLFTRPCSADPYAAALPWDGGPIAMQNMLIGTVASAAIVLAFSAAVILYALGGRDEQAGRLFGSALGGCISLVVVHLLNYVLP